MRHQDFSGLLRSTIGFDRIPHFLAALEAELPSPSFPPYNIEKLADDSYRITMAVAGFAKENISVGIENRLLKVTGSNPPDESGKNYLHRGIAARSFERSF